MGAALLRDDHKASAESFACAFDLLAEIPATRHLALLGDINEPWGNVDGLYRDLALRLARSCDGAYLVGQYPQRWLAGLLAGGMPRDKIVCNLRSLDDETARLQRDVRPGDVVLIKGRQEERLQRVALALAGRPVACALRTCESMNLACDRCGGRGPLFHHSPVMPAQDEELTTEVLDAVEHSLWRRYNDRVVGDYLSPRLGSTDSVFLKTDAFEEALGNRRCPEIAPAGMVGMDISRTVLGHARQRMPRLPLVRADVRVLPIADGVLAGVVSTSTLDHFHDSWDLDQSLGEIARVLRPGGQLLLTLDNPWNPLLAFRNLVPHRLRLSLKMTPYYVGCTYDPDQLVRVLDGLGFEVREVSAVLHFPRTLVGLWGILSRKAGLVRLDEPLLGILARAELPATWRTRWLTGQYIAVHALRSESTPKPRRS
jgi:SAM-dependent methyltransferase